MRHTLSLVVVCSLVVGCRGGGDDAPPPPDGPPQTTEVVCEELPPVTSGTCAITDGGDTILIKGIVLTPATLYRGGQVAVNASGQITCVGCDCAAGGETVITCPDGAISPGLINTHDHITFTQNPPYTDTGERYEHRHQWRKGQDGHPKIPASGGATQNQIMWGELRFLMGGATSIVGSGGAPGLLRNLDTSQQEGLAENPVNFDTFPLDDSSGNRRTDDCNYGGEPTTANSIAGDDAYEPHTAEGIDTSAHNEFLCESSDDYDPGRSNNLLLPKTAMIHGIGLQAADFGAMATAGTGLIWSPRSNITLYGDTARVVTAHRMGVEIALGTDWMPTGSMNLLRELRCADSLNQTYFHYFTDVQLWQMVTSNAAALTATDDVIGLLAPGKVADIAIFAAHGKTFRAVIEAEPQDVVLVMRGGTVIYGDKALVDATAQGTCDTLDVCGTSKAVCIGGGSNLEQLQNSIGTGIYPAFACGQPENEPTCVPSRPASVDGSTIYTGIPSASDSDGDGIDDGDDKCPSVFDPIRPMDGGQQADADGDGDGDVCDICPLDADTTSCTGGDPNDRDGDGFANDVDNCPDDPNDDQADADVDGKGDVCDACPTASNPGTTGCPATIYQIKDGTLPVGTTVRVSNALVTGTGASGFFVQVKETDAGYTSADHSGLFVFTGTGSAVLANATVGARVTIDGKIAVFQTQIELDTVTAVTVDAAGPEALPAPVPATYNEVKTGGTRADTLESVIVSLTELATVTANNPNFGEFTLSVGGTNLVADDFLFVPAALPAVGTKFSAVKGVLTRRFGVQTIEPRSANDLTLGAPGIQSFSPALSFARVGTTTNAPTFPTPLTVTLTGPAQGNTLVTISSGDANKLQVANVTIPNGQTSATVNVTAQIADPNAITVTATLSGQQVTSQVRVLGTAEAPTTVALSPDDASVTVGGTVQFTVTLDTPALVNTQVALAVNPANAGTLPANVTVNANQVSANFTYTNQATSGTATVSATFNGNTSNATVTVNTGANHLVINEVDYDSIGTDGTEYIEIYNPTGSALSLSGIVVVLINGADNVAYDMIDLSSVGSLPSKGYLVIAGAAVTVNPPALKLDPGWSTNQVQNGSPDGIALINNTTHTLIDALSYEGSMTAAELPGFATPQSLVEGTALSAAVADSNTVAGSLCRTPDGQDTDNASADWAFCSVLSAGTANP